MSSVELVDGAIPFSEFARVMASKETAYSCKEVLKAFAHFQGKDEGSPSKQVSRPAPRPAPRRPPHLAR